MSQKKTYRKIKELYPIALYIIIILLFAYYEAERKNTPDYSSASSAFSSLTSTGKY